MLSMLYAPTGHLHLQNKDRVRLRVQQPWRSEHLRDNFIVLRRRIGCTEQDLVKDPLIRI